jgi:hypothetical protein
VALARDNEARTYGPRRCTLGRAAIAELVLLVAPSSHKELAQTICGRDLWGFLTPAATRGNHAAMLQRVHEDIAVPTPLWPDGVHMACLVGAPPAHYIGNNLVMLAPELVALGAAAFTKLEDESDAAEYLASFLREARDGENAVLLHWDYR